MAKSWMESKCTAAVAATALPLLVALAIACGGAKEERRIEPPAPAPATAPVVQQKSDSSIPAYWRGWFQEVQTGDADHVIAADESLADRSFWGFGDLDDSSSALLLDTSPLSGRVVLIAFDWRKFGVAGPDVTVEGPLVRTLWFPDVKEFPSRADITLEEFDNVVSVARKFSVSSGAPAGAFKIVSPAIRGDEAWAIALISQDHPELAGESALVRLVKKNGKWTGVDYGTGLEPPEWYFFR